MCYYLNRGANGFLLGSRMFRISQRPPFELGHCPRCIYVKFHTCKTCQNTFLLACFGFLHPEREDTTGVEYNPMHLRRDNDKMETRFPRLYCCRNLIRHIFINNSSQPGVIRLFSNIFIYIYVFIVI